MIDYNNTYKIKITSCTNGAYIVTEIRNKVPFSLTQFAISRLIGSTITAVQHGSNYFKSIVKLSTGQQGVILICDKDCVVV